MADLGAIGSRGVLVAPVFAGYLIRGPARSGVVAIVTNAAKRVTLGCPGQVCDLYIGVTRNTVEGSPDAPALSMDRANIFPVRWPVLASVANTFSIKVKQPVAGTLRPRIYARADASLGVAADVEAVAAAGTGWLTIGPISVTPSASGVLQVILENRTDAIPATCYWDGIATTPAVPTNTFAFWKDGAPVFNFGGEPTSAGSASAFSFVI